MNNYKSTLKKVPKVLLLFYLFLISSPIISHSAALFQDKPSSESNLEIDFFCSRSINTINSHSETDNSPEDVIKPNFLIVAPCTAELENTTPTPFGDNSCGGSESTMTFNITDNLTISDLNVGLNISVLTHRHHFQVVLTSPMGTSATLVTAPQSANFADNIDITLDDSSSDPILDIDDDDLTAPFYDRLAMPDNPLSVFNGENAMGNWTMTICDDNSADSAIGGTLNQAQLFFEGDCPSSNTNPADYLISTLNGQTTNTCTGIFADSGDTNSNYSDNEILTTTFCSDANNHISFTFNHFNTEAGSDILNIYDGTSTGATLLGAYSGFGEANSPGVITSSDLCLTFEFTSSASTTSVGWLASIKCTGSPVPTSTGSSWAGYPEGSTCSTEIGGIVYEDLDQDGQRDSDDSPISGVTVTLFDDNGQVGSPMLSDVNGAYLFSGLNPTTVYRIEFTAYGGFEEGPQGSNNNTDIQFVDGGSCDVDFSVVDPRHYCGDGNPFWTIPCYNNGDPQDPTNILATGIARFEYTDSGDSPAPSYMNYVSFGSVGTIWGTSFSHANNTGYYGTLLKRHAGIGPDGIGAIYMHVDGTPNTSAPLFYDFGSTAGVVDNNMVRFPGTGTGFGQEGACGMCDNVDPTTFGQIGKVGFGDLDLGPDGDFLYVTNLADRKIYKISTQNPAPGSATPLPGIPWLDNSICNDGVARPWALEWRRGKLYVGVMCDASLSACAIGAACPDLTANVFSFDGTTWTQEISFPMDYYREAYAAGSDYPVKWIDNWSAMAPFVNNVTDANFLQPILMDIEFDDDNNMIIGIGDRSGFQMGYRSANPTANADDDSERNFAFGDVLKTCYDPVSDTYTLENNGSVCGNTTTNPTNDTGPGGKSFYWGDYWTGIGANKYQAGIGSLAYLPCSDEIMFPIGDAIDYYSNGVIWIDNTDGSANNKIEIYQGSPNGNAPNFAKSSGVGDIEFMDTTPGPLEIGNIVWWDENNNGLQDPSESGIDAVALELWKDDGSGTFVKVAETTTDAYGRYIFSSSSNANGLNAETWTFTADDNVLPFSNYEIRISSWNTDTGIINFRNTLGYTGHLISPTMNQGANGIERDNNGADVSSDVVTSLTTGGPSQNDHSYDFAFSGVGGCDKPRVVVNANTPCEGEDIVFSTSVLVEKLHICIRGLDLMVLVQLHKALQ